MDDKEPFSVQLRLSTARFTLGSAYRIPRKVPNGTAGPSMELCTRRSTARGKHRAPDAAATEEA